MIGALRGNARISIFPTNLVQKTESPRPEPGALVALRIDAAQSALAIHHGGFLFYEPTEVVARGAIGRLSVVELGDQAAPVVGVLDRAIGDRGGLVTIFGGSETIESAQLQSATPVLWQRMG